QVVMFTTKEELYGREKVSSYFRERYFHQSSPARLVIHESAFHAMGDAVWYEYEFTIDSARGRLRGRGVAMCKKAAGRWRDRKSTRLNSSHVAISYAVFCLKKKNAFISEHNIRSLIYY